MMLRIVALVILVARSNAAFRQRLPTTRYRQLAPPAVAAEDAPQVADSSSRQQALSEAAKLGDWESALARLD